MIELIYSLTAIYQEDKHLFGGPKRVEFRLVSGITVQIEQLGIRTIHIYSEESKTVQELYSILTKTERLLMLFDGRFYDLKELILASVDKNQEEHLKSLSFNLLHSRLLYFVSDDMYKYDLMHLIDMEDVLSTQLYNEWDALLDELETVNQMYLYALSDCGLTKDITCAFLIELAESLVEIVKLRKNLFPDLNLGKKGTSLGKCVKGIIQQYGTDIFERELNANFDKFTEVVVYSRVKIMHIKRTMVNKLSFNGKESVLYGVKFSLLYRKVMFDLLNIPEAAYSEKLRRAIYAYGKWNGILDCFLLKL